MAELLKGAPTSASYVRGIREKLQGETAKLRFIGTDADPSFFSYGKRIAKTAREAGITAEITAFPADVSEETFLGAVREANDDSETDGILLSMPLPEQISFDRVQQLMKPEKDVDGLTLSNRGLLYEGRPRFMPCTAEAVLRFLEYYGISVSGTRAVIIGRSPVVGRPLAMGLLALDATVTICHRRTKDLFSVTKEADILISAAGSAGLITAEAVKPGAVVIDLGMSKNPDGELVGDVDVLSVSEAASKVAPAFGGVGVLTTAVLLTHVAEAHLNRC